MGSWGLCRDAGGLIWGWGGLMQRAIAISPDVDAAVHGVWVVAWGGGGRGMRGRGWPWWVSWPPPPTSAHPTGAPHLLPPAHSATSSLTSCKTWWTTSTTSMSNPRRTPGTAATGRAAPATAGASTPGGQRRGLQASGGGSRVPGGGAVLSCCGETGAQHWGLCCGRFPASQPFGMVCKVLGGPDDRAGLDVPVVAAPPPQSQGIGTRRYPGGQGCPPHTDVPPTLAGTRC